MDCTLAEIDTACRALRCAHADALSVMSQADIVRLIAEWTARWSNPTDPFRLEAEALDDPFPFAMTRVSLDALLASLTPAAIDHLIDAEDVRDGCGPPVIGHVIAGNTPLLSWVSLLRALLMRSASLVKLPSGPAAAWGRLFVRSLHAVSPAAASTIALLEWPGGTPALDAALCRNADLVLAYGSGSTLDALRAQCRPAAKLIGYGHRLSFGLCPRGTDADAAASGFARDVLLYDQGGCLSPHTIFAEGTPADAFEFGEKLAAALAENAATYPLSTRSQSAGMYVDAARLLARMTPETHVWEGDALRWTVIARPDLPFAASPTFGVISVQPLAHLDLLPRALAPVVRALQGCALAPSVSDAPALCALRSLNISRVCAPGELQAPPFLWRQDGRDVLRSLLIAYSLPCGDEYH